MKLNYQTTLQPYSIRATVPSLFHIFPITFLYNEHLKKTR